MTRNIQSEMRMCLNHVLVYRTVSRYDLRPLSQNQNLNKQKETGAKASERDSEPRRHKRLETQSSWLAGREIRLLTCDFDVSFRVTDTRGQIRITCTCEQSIAYINIYLTPSPPLLSFHLALT
jgi:hypothetical protein